MRRWIVLMALVIFSAMAAGKPPAPDYKLAWSDEFSGTRLDETKWDYRALGPRRDAVNVKECVSVSGGRLHLKTQKVGDECQTAMIATEGKFETTYGYFECRMKLQTQVGHWAAFWLQSPTIRKVGDTKANGVEVDVVEYLRKNPETALINMHWDGYGKDHKTIGTKVNVPKLDRSFHTFAVEWTPDGWTYFIDDNKVWQTDKAPSQRPEYMILSLEVGKWAGDIADATLPDGIEVDWVRVWKKAPPG